MENRPILYQMRDPQLNPIQCDMIRVSNSHGLKLIKMMRSAFSHVSSEE